MNKVFPIIFIIVSIFNFVVTYKSQINPPT